MAGEAEGGNRSRLTVPKSPKDSTASAGMAPECLAAVRYLRELEPPLRPETIARLCDEVPRQGLTLPVLRALGHQGLVDVLGIDSVVERARIIASEGIGIIDPLSPRKVKHKGKLVRTFEVRRVNFLQIQSVDPINQAFDAHIFFELAIRGGALDEHLMQDTEEFTYPYPSAKWFWHQQVDFSNSISHEVLESKVLQPKDSDDILCQLRVRGTFSETLEFSRFPLDFQDLTVTLEIKCAKEGPVPARIDIPEDVHASVRSQHFSMANVWMLSPVVRCSQGMAGVDLDTDRPKTYAALNCSAGVARLSLFYFANIIFPLAVFSLMAIISAAAVDRRETADRCGNTLTLVLTAAAYKLATAGMLPTIAYLTLLDYYVLTCSFVMALVTVHTCVTSSHFVHWLFVSDWSEEALDDLDRLSLWAILGLWCAVQLLFAFLFWLGLRARRRGLMNRETPSEVASKYRVAPSPSAHSS